MKLLDWGDDSIATTAEITALRSSFRQEVAVWQKLNHPNVTKVQILTCYSFSEYTLDKWQYYNLKFGILLCNS